MTGPGAPAPTPASSVRAGGGAGAPGIRRIRAGDLDALITLEDAAFSEPDRFARRIWRHLCGPALRRGSTVGWVFEQDGRLGGAILCLLRRTSSVGRIYTIAVDPALRGQGIARRLIAAACEQLPKRVVTLSLEVRVDNLAAKGLYDRLGFRISEGLTGYYGDGGHGVRMRAQRSAVARACA